MLEGACRRRAGASKYGCGAPLDWVFSNQFRLKWRTARRGNVHAGGDAIHNSLPVTQYDTSYVPPPASEDSMTKLVPEIW